VIKSEIAGKKVAYHLCAMNVVFDDMQLANVARIMYLQCETTVKELAQIILVEQEVVDKWIQNGEWDSFRQSLSISKKKQLKYLYKALNTLTSKLNATDEPAHKDVELMVKYSTMIKNIDTEHDLTGLLHIAETFVRWLYKKNEPLAKTVTLELETYIKEQKAS
jgi:hypothetical protein